MQYLSEVLSTLNPQEISILRLKYQDGLEIQQIADQMNITDSAVKMRLKRTRDKVRHSYEELAYCIA